MIQKILLLVVFGLCLLLVGVKVVPHFSNDRNNPLGGDSSMDSGFGDLENPEYHEATRDYFRKNYHDAELGFREILLRDGGHSRAASIALAQTLDADGKTNEAYNMYRAQLNHASTSQMLRGDFYMNLISLERYGELTIERNDRQKSVILHQRLVDIMERAPAWSMGPTGAILSDQDRTFATTAQLRSSYEVMRGLIYYMDEDTTSEGIAYQRAAQLDPASGSAQFCWAYALSVRGKTALSNVAFDQAEKYSSPKLKPVIVSYRMAFSRAVNRPRFRRSPVRVIVRTVPPAPTQ